MLSVRKSQRLFFETFEGMARGGVEAAGVLVEMFQNGRETYETHAAKIKDIEHRCDDLVHQMVRELNRTFITPFDREDIYDLGTSLDDIVDLIDAAASRTVLFKVGSDMPDAAGLAGVIRRQSEQILEAISHLREPNSMLDQCRRIKDLETEGDRLYREAMVRLFDNGADPLFVIKAKEIIEVLEAATDAGDRIAIVLERIVLKNQ
jgi:predicted phosphate transport protein (TIGR00153 family)